MEEIFYIRHCVRHHGPWILTWAPNGKRVRPRAQFNKLAQPRKLWRRKTHITADTWDLVDKKKALFKQLKALNKVLAGPEIHPV